MHSAPVPHFSFLDMSEMTANASISEPVAESVRTEKMGSAEAAFDPSSTRSHGSPSYLAPAATTLAQSMVEPPPMASTMSTPSRAQRPTPRRTVSMRGLGSTPESSTTSMPAWVKIRIASS